MKEFASNMWDVTRGKPRAAASDGIEGLEDQDKIQIDKVDRIGDEAQSDAQNNDGTLEAYVPRSLFLHLYQAGATSTPYIYFSSFIFLFFLNKIYFLLKKIYSILIAFCCRLDCKFSIHWIKGMKHGAT